MRAVPLRTDGGRTDEILMKQASHVKRKQLSGRRRPAGTSQWMFLARPLSLILCVLHLNTA